MSARLSSSIVVFSASDKGLTETLQSLGAKVERHSIDDIATYAASSGSPDVAIIDVRRGAEFPEGTAAFRRRYAECPMVLVSTALDPALMLEAMRSGINECVTEPLSEQSLAAAIGRVSAQKQPDANGDVYAFIGAKGGIGTTTLAVNAATALAKRERTLLIDLHATGGDAAVFLGVEPRFSVSDALENIHRLDESVFKSLTVTTSARIDLLASTGHTTGWSLDAKRLRPLFELVRRLYRYVVVDCPRSDGAVMEALEGATRIVLVTNQELATLKNGSRLSSMLRQRYGGNRVMVVANRFDAGADISHQDIERVLGTTIKHAIPNDYRASIEALTAGTPLILRNHTRMVGPIDALARDLAGLPAKAPVQARGGGILGILTGKR